MLVVGLLVVGSLDVTAYDVTAYDVTAYEVTAYDVTAYDNKPTTSKLATGLVVTGSISFKTEQTLGRSAACPLRFGRALAVRVASPPLVTAERIERARHLFSVCWMKC